MKITAIYSDQALKEHDIDPQEIRKAIKATFAPTTVVGKITNLAYDEEQKYFILEMDLDFDIAIGGMVRHTASDLSNGHAIDNFHLHDIELYAVPKPEEKENVE